ncbi:Hypothetical protein A7982_08534 [Minicystis rosea]|nr:Hypothetical protein A7982_08534 [Minicystis rosea]
MRVSTILVCAAILVAASACGSSIETAGTGGATSTTSSTSATSSSGAGEPGACVSDAECGFRESGCCGVCASLTDVLPPPMGCGVPCAAPLPCTCVAGRCAEAALPLGSDCDPAADLCASGTKCCATCCGSDGGIGDPMPKCTNVLGGTCPVF